MQYTDCHGCDKKSLPITKTLNIDDNNYCEDCLEKKFNTEESLKGKVVKENIDDTICFSCGKEDMLQSLEKIGEYSVCVECKKTIRNREFPIWVKAFFFAVLAIVVFSFYWNWKYFDAYKSLIGAYEHADKGEFKEAEKLISEVYNIVPEDNDVIVLNSYFKGLNYLSQDLSGLAVQELEKCEGYLPVEFGLPVMLTQAKMGLSFDNENYPAFLNYSEEYLSYDTTVGFSYAVVASAEACMYAETGELEHKKKAEQLLDKAIIMDTISGEIEDYEGRIRHRLASRTIITKEEFDKKYPNGWPLNN